MFCNNCGKELPDGAKFCNHCGAQLKTAPAAPTAPQPPRPNSGYAAPQQALQSYTPPQPRQDYSTSAADAQAKKKSKTIGIILLAIGALSFIGALSNGSYANLQHHFDLADMVSILIQIGLVVGGFRMIAKSKD